LLCSTKPGYCNPAEGRRPGRSALCHPGASGLFRHRYPRTGDEFCRRFSRHCFLWVPIRDRAARPARCGGTLRQGLRVVPERPHTNAYGVHCGLVWGGPLERRLLSEVWTEADRRKLCSSRFRIKRGLGVPLSSGTRCADTATPRSSGWSTWIGSVGGQPSTGQKSRAKPSSCAGKKHCDSAFRPAQVSSILLSLTAHPRPAGTVAPISPMCRVGVKVFFCFDC
jgi:hypothetical protein